MCVPETRFYFCGAIRFFLFLFFGSWGPNVSILAQSSVQSGWIQYNGSPHSTAGRRNDLCRTARLTNDTAPPQNLSAHWTETRVPV